MNEGTGGLQFTPASVPCSLFNIWSCGRVCELWADPPIKTMSLTFVNTVLKLPKCPLPQQSVSYTFHLFHSFYYFCQRLLKTRHHALMTDQLFFKFSFLNILNPINHPEHTCLQVALPRALCSLKRSQIQWIHEKADIKIALVLAAIILAYLKCRQRRNEE